MADSSAATQNDMTIQMGFVYENESGVRRLVVSIESRRVSPVAIWRTADPSLPKGDKSQGSATVASFRRWAVKMRKATPEDWDAFALVERKREWQKLDRKTITRIKKLYMKS